MAFSPEGDMLRFDAPAEGIIVHTNDTLLCKTCKYKQRPVGSCRKFPDRKPKDVLNGADTCPEYVEKKRRARAK